MVRTWLGWARAGSLLDAGESLQALVEKSDVCCEVDRDNAEKFDIDANVDIDKAMRANKGGHATARATVNFVSLAKDIEVHSQVEIDQASNIERQAQISIDQRALVMMRRALMSVCRFGGLSDGDGVSHSVVNRLGRFASSRLRGSSGLLC